MLADLTLIQGKLRSAFPDASIKLSQVRDHFVVEGEARDPAQIARIIETIRAYLTSVLSSRAGPSRVRQDPGQVASGSPGGRRRTSRRSSGPGAAGAEAPENQNPPAVPCPPDANRGRCGIPPCQGIVPGAAVQPGAEGAEAPVNPFAAYAASAELAGPTQVSNRGAPPQIINLLRVAGSQQVMLKVRIAELNRTALRRIGANFLGVDPRTGAIVGSSIAGPTAYQGTIGQPGNLLFGNQLFGSSSLGPNGANSTVFGIFQHANFEFSLTALRQNGLLKILAEPNLVALNGQLASFLAGGEFPVPVPSPSPPSQRQRRRPHDHRPVPRVRRPPRLRPLHPRRRRHPAHRRPRGQQH